MKKITLMLLITASGSLLGKEFPDSQQPVHQTPRPTQQQANQTVHQNQTRITQVPRSPQRSVTQTPGPRITAEAGRQLNEMFQNAMNREIASRPTAQR